MLSKNKSLVNTNQKGSSLSLPAHGRAGARATPFLAALFAKQKTKFGGGKARAGREFIFPTPLFLPAPSERKLSKVSVRIFAEKSSDFVQDRQPKDFFIEGPRGLNFVENPLFADLFFNG